MSDMVLRPRNGLSLCAGGGGLDLGLMLAEPGFHTRAAVEWEEYPRASIIAAQCAGYFAPAPIWDDLTTFDARPFRGAFDIILAGYPCQPFSMAGKRLGEDDPRHLWPHVARVIRELGPGLEWVFLENVSGHVTLGAETVLRELWDMGFTPSTGIFSASEVGASHERQRWFCVAHRTQRGQRVERDATQPGCRGHADRGDGDLADANGGGTGSGAQPHAKFAPITEGRWQCAEFGDDCRFLDHSTSPRCDSTGIGAEAHSGSGERLSGARCDAVADAARPDGERDGWQSARRAGPANGGQHMADASQPGPQGRERPGSPDQRHGAAAHGSASERGRPRLFPPGPGDRAAWQAVLASARDLAPSGSLRDLHTWARDLEAATGQRWEAALEPDLCRMVDGLAARSQPLRLLGNGVHPLAAAYAWRTLASSHGLGPVDMEAADRDGAGNSDEPVGMME